MEKVGDVIPVKFWGETTVKKIAKLKPIHCYCKEKGKSEFMPTILKVSWKKSPYADSDAYWFRYWINWREIENKFKYAQYGPIIGKKDLLRLFKVAIEKDLFDNKFLKELDKSIRQKLK